MNPLKFGETFKMAIPSQAREILKVYRLNRWFLSPYGYGKDKVQTTNNLMIGSENYSGKKIISVSVQIRLRVLNEPNYSFFLFHFLGYNLYNSD